jgi:purine nucleosidase
MTTPVILIHDGAVDELVCIPFLVSMAPQIQLSSVWITPADCLGYPTASACQRLFNLLGQASLPLFLSDSSSERPFPWEYRQYAMMVNLLPILNPVNGPAIGSPQTVSFANARQAAADAFRQQVLAASDATGNPVTMLITSPMTDFAAAIETDPSILSSISEVVWMGGTINAPGNIDTGIAPGANPNAEWNAYWDPQSVLTVLQSGVKLSMFPLDITNSTLLAPSTLDTYFLPQASSSVMIDLVCQMYALVAFQGGYSFWDTLTAAYLGMPGLFAFQSMNLDIDVDPQSSTLGQFHPGTFPVNVCTAFTTEQGATTFYQYLASQLGGLTTV